MRYVQQGLDSKSASNQEIEKTSKLKCENRTCRRGLDVWPMARVGRHDCEPHRDKAGSSDCLDAPQQPIAQPRRSKACRTIPKVSPKVQQNEWQLSHMEMAL